MSGAAGNASFHDPRFVPAAWRAARWLALLAGAGLMAACAAPSAHSPQSEASPVAAHPSKPAARAAASQASPSSAAPAPASDATGRARRAAELPPVSTVVPAVAPTGVPGPGGLYSLDEEKSSEGLRKPSDGEAESGQQGMASWYGSRFHRRRTASGERFDMYALTAAHPTLPFGTRVCVRSLVTGKTVQVRINDRGPHTPGRIIDLSQAAAKRLGMLGLGTKQVAITALADDDQSGCTDKQDADDDQ